jgi:sulfide:quinone oxidoreductase
VSAHHRPATLGERPRVLVAGGGVAAVEVALALRAAAGRRVGIELVAPQDALVYRPLAVAEPFGEPPAPRLPLARLERTHAVGHLADVVEAVDPDARRARLEHRGWVRYDHLVIATGARTRSWLPGSLMFGGTRDVPAYRRLLDRIAAGDARSLVFAASARPAWPLPLYELALLTAAWIADRHIADMDLRMVTPEPEPLSAFGPAAARAVRDLLGDRGVRLHANDVVAAVEPRRVVLRGGLAWPADAVVSLPELFGDPPIGLPADRDGFLPVDDRGCVVGAPGVWAIGDAAAHAVKQGGLATQQADAVAAGIASDAGVAVEPEPYRPVLEGELLNGVTSAFLRARLTGERESWAAFQAPWSPGTKVIARHLGPYLEAHGDRVPRGVAEADDRADLRRMALAFAQADAALEHYDSALRWLHTVETLEDGARGDVAALRERWEAARCGSESPA